MVEPPSLPGPGAARPPARLEDQGPSRRRVLTGLAGAAALGPVAAVVGGCSAGGTVRRAVGIGGPAPLSPDVRVATRALAAVRETREQVAATQARYPGLAPSLAPLVAVHRAHEASLVDAVPREARATTPVSPSPTPGTTPSPTSPTPSAATATASGASPSVSSVSSVSSSPTPSPSASSSAPGATGPAERVPATRARALTAVLTREQQLHATLDGLAMTASSGEFARLLASMGAAVAQRLQAVPAS